MNAGKRRPKGSGGATQDKSGRWVAEVRRDGVRIRRIGATQAEAMARLEQALGGDLYDPDDPTVGQWFDQWLETKRAAKGELRDYTGFKYRQLFDKHLRPEIGRIKVRDLTAARVEGLFATLAASGLSASTRRNVRQPFRASLDRAVSVGLIQTNPCAVRIAGKSERRSLVSVSYQDARDLLAAVSGSYYADLWAILLMTGMRVGEALALDWSDVDLRKRVILVRRNLARVRTKDGTMERGFGNPKTAAGYRVVPIADDLMPILVRRQESRTRVEGLDGGLLFPGRRNPALPTSQTVALRALHRELEGTRFGPIPQHSLRHWAATLLIGSGVPIPTVSKILGHASPVITMALYAGVHTDTERAAVNALSVNSRAAGRNPVPPASRPRRRHVVRRSLVVSAT